MVVLNIYSKISTICISKKLGLYIGNLPNESGNNWNKRLYEIMCESKNKILDSQIKFNISEKLNIYNFANEVLQKQNNINSTEEKLIHKLVDNMICIYFDYEYEDMPLGCWETNCFDCRLCEEDYAEKFINFINFAGGVLEYDDSTPIQWIYSSNCDFHNQYRIFWYNKESKKGIATLKQWGELFDIFLQNKNDYLKLDYLINSIHNDNTYNEYHLFKLYSLCQLFLEKDSEKELDWKLLQFLDEYYSLNDKKKLATILRQMRNKIAHGDFSKFEELVEKYAVNFMDGKYNFDYSEYSRKNWVILNVCCLLQNILKKMIKMMFYNKKELLKLKNQKFQEKQNIN